MMACITVPMDKSTKEKLEEFPWVNWSEVGREEMLKKDIFERYVKTGEVSEEDWKFCKKIDWHPVDEFSMKESHIKKLKTRLKEESAGKRYNSAEEFFKKIR